MSREVEEALHALRQFGVLKRSQIMVLLCKHNKVDAERTLQWMIKSGYVFENGDYIQASPILKANDRIIMAFEIMLRFINRIGDKAYFSVDFPVQIFFQIGGRDYEIAVFFENEEYIMSMFANSNKGNKEATYIIGLNDENLISSISAMEGKVVFAIITPDQTSIRFYEHSAGIEVKE